MSTPVNLETGCNDISRWCESSPWFNNQGDDM